MHGHMTRLPPGRIIRKPFRNRNLVCPVPSRPFYASTGSSPLLSGAKTRYPAPGRDNLFHARATSPPLQQLPGRHLLRLACTSLPAACRNCLSFCPVRFPDGPSPIAGSFPPALRYKTGTLFLHTEPPCSLPDPFTSRLKSVIRHVPFPCSPTGERM